MRGGHGVEDSLVVRPESGESSRCERYAEIDLFLLSVFSLSLSLCIELNKCSQSIRVNPI